MAGTTIKGVGNDGNVQIRDMVTAAKQNAGTGFQAVWNKTQNNAQTTGNDGRTTDGRNDVRRGQSLRPVTDSGITSPEHRKSQMSKQRIVTPKIWKKSRKSWEPSYRT